MIYGDPGTVVKLNIAGGPGGYQLSVPPGLRLAREVAMPGFEPAEASWRYPAKGAVASVGTAFATPVSIRTGDDARTGPGGVTLQRGNTLQSGALGVDFGTTADPRTSQTPHRLRLSFRGIVPPRVDGALLFEMLGWNIGHFRLTTRYGNDQLECVIGRNGEGEGGFFSTILRTPGVEQLLEVEWRDKPGAPGGTVAFFIDGKPAGGPFPTKMKLRVAPEMDFSVNVSLGNGRQAIDGLVVKELRVAFDRPVTRYNYPPVASGPIDGAMLPALVVDARAVTSPQPARTLAWRAPDGAVSTLDIVVGPIDVPAGQAYKAVLEDWSSGQGVPHPHALVMTRIAAQNCRFEDGWLGAAQPAWTECLPRGPVPVIGGIAYYCEAIRSGDYVQFQFGYDWDEKAMPANPFGEPLGKHSYMVPHKWRIYDRDDRLIATVETPDGGPLNGTDKPYLFEGEHDGRGCAMISRKDKWYPHGTVRSGVIWRSADPGEHEAAAVRRVVPLFDLSIPFGCHMDYSVNGFDLRIFSGGAGNEGQANGFGNVRVIPWEQSDYRTMVGNADRTKDPFRASLYSANSMAANAALWLKYTPFNIQGRSPITGTGGMRDDRQIIAEPVAWAMSAPDGLRPHDRIPWRRIALDYLTGYASDPIHAFEKGRNVPLFKGNPRRPIVLRNHYYGVGDLAMPMSQAWHQQGGRVAGWLAGTAPLRVAVPYAGDTPSTPYFGTFQIDKLHGHQFPGWGSLMYRTPEFAFLGHRFWDQNRLYSNVILGDSYLDLWASRDGAWAYLHAALAWKTASATSQRLYDRAEILEFAVSDFTYFHDTHYAATPGFLHPPTHVLAPDGGVDEIRAVYAAAQYFGAVGKFDGHICQHEISVGYWLSALAAAEKMGFNDALRQASPKAHAVIDWLIAMHRKRIVGRLVGAPRLQPMGMMSGIWGRQHIIQAGGDVARLPQGYDRLEKVWGSSPTWDVFVADDGRTIPRDGQAMDQIVAGPSLLRYLLGQGGDDLIEAQAVANRWREQKRAEELARGDGAGSAWFGYLQATNNPARAAQG